MTEAFPLQWPEGWARTLAHRRGRARYKLTPDAATSHMGSDRLAKARIHELLEIEAKRLGGE